jgi:hypothetical protein
VEENLCADAFGAWLVQAKIQIPSVQIVEVEIGFKRARDFDQFATVSDLVAGV